MFAFAMRASKGALSHQAIMEMPYNAFFQYIDALGYSIRSETKDGQKENNAEDAREIAQENPVLPKDILAIKRGVQNLGNQSKISP